MTTDILAPARHVIGSRYVESVKPYILELTNMRIVAGPNDITDRMLRSDRVKIHADADGFITGLSIG